MRSDAERAAEMVPPRALGASPLLCAERDSAVLEKFLRRGSSYLPWRLGVEAPRCLLFYLGLCTVMGVNSSCLGSAGCVGVQGRKGRGVRQRLEVCLAVGCGSEHREQKPWSRMMPLCVPSLPGTDAVGQTVAVCFCDEDTGWGRGRTRSGTHSGNHHSLDSNPSLCCVVPRPFLPKLITQARCETTCSL